jgi:hypothetical protein
MLGLFISLASHSLSKTRRSDLIPRKQGAPARRSRSGEGPGDVGMGNEVAAVGDNFTRWWPEELG